MHWLNYHHLLYFWTVVREGSITRAAEVLHLAQPTISSQLRDLENALKAALLVKRGRGLELTDTGRVVFRYAEDIFALGREMQDVLAGGHTGRAIQLRVGVVDVLPKMLVHLLLGPALRLPEPICLVCTEGKLERLIPDLAVHQLDVVLSDRPVPPSVKTKIYTHLLGTCGVSIMGVPQLARNLKEGFPKSLNGQPMLVPTEETVLRRSLEQWFDDNAIRPFIRGEFDDSALLKMFGRQGEGVFPIPTAIENEVRRQYGCRRIGKALGLRERFYALSAERRLKHPAVLAISREATEKIAAGEENQEP
jgi:LysR family transcriptional regulator, transcriptional activator of nhaA